MNRQRLQNEDDFHIEIGGNINNLINNNFFLWHNSVFLEMITKINYEHDHDIQFFDKTIRQITSCNEE